MKQQILRQQKLSYSRQDLISCRKGVQSFLLAKKLRHHYLVVIFLGVIILAFFLKITWFALNNKKDIIEQTGDFGDVFYYLFVGVTVLLDGLFLWTLIENIWKFINASKEKISSITVTIDEIEYKITANRSYAPYLKVKNFKFGPILPIKKLTEIFNPNAQYKFYYSSKTKTLLAVDEIS